MQTSVRCFLKVYDIMCTAKNPTSFQQNQIGSVPGPGSNPTSLTVKNPEDRQSDCVYCKISGQRGKTELGKLFQPYQPLPQLISHDTCKQNTKVHPPFYLRAVWAEGIE